MIELYFLGPLWFWSKKHLICIENTGCTEKSKTHWNRKYHCNESVKRYELVQTGKLGLLIFSLPCQRQCELLPSLGVGRPLTFHILIFSSEPLRPNELVGSIYGGALYGLLISTRSVYKHGCHRQFLFLIGWLKKNLLLWNRVAKWTEIWYEAPMEGSV